MLNKKPAYKIASIPGDGIGVEVTEATIQVLNKITSSLTTFSLDFVHFDWSSKNYQRLGYYIPPDGLENLKKHDAILFGAVGSPGVFLPNMHMIAETLFGLNEC